MNLLLLKDGDFEMELLRRQGFEPISLGPRILRVEVAVPFALGWIVGRKIAQLP